MAQFLLNAKAPAPTYARTATGTGGNMISELDEGYYSPFTPGLVAIAPPVPVAKELKGGQIGGTYSETISAQAGTTPYSFSVASGSLPAGTALNSSTGVISGTLTTVGTNAFTILVTDANSATGTQQFSVDVVAPSSGGNYGYVS